MRPKTLFALAVAGSLAFSAGALAGGKHPQQTVEVQTPSSLSEAGPSLHDAPAIGASSSMSASGQVSYDSTVSSSANAEYWRIDEQPSGVGSTRDMGASGSIRFDSSNPGLE